MGYVMNGVTPCELMSGFDIRLHCNMINVLDNDH